MACRERQSLADFGGADRYERQRERQKAAFLLVISVELACGPAGLCTTSYTNYSNLQNALPLVPLPERCELICTHDKIELRPRIFDLQCLQRVYCEGRSCTSQFTVVDQGVRNPFKRQPGHGQSMRCIAQGSGLVPCVPGGNNVQYVQRKIIQCNAGQSDVSIVRRIKRTAKNTDAFWCRTGQCRSQTQTQSRLTKNSLYKRSSCDPASTGR